MSKGYFIAGTDTGIGKTTVTQSLMRNARNKRIAAMKPVASGCQRTAQGLRNGDALALAQCASIELPYEMINPYAFERPISPHIAAAELGVPIDINHIVECYHYIAQRSDTVYVEGVGGWMTPISKKQNMADVATALNLPVILVVGLRLGCLNHAMLTTAQIQQQGLHLTGWIANQLEPEMPKLRENLDYLSLKIDAPLLCVTPHLKEINT